MPRFSLKDLLITTALCGAGLVSMRGATRLPKSSPDNDVWVSVFALLWFGGSALIGAGLLTPFKKMWFGAAVGLVAQVVLLGLIFLAA
jgi:hypothetical protein